MVSVGDIGILERPREKCGGKRKEHDALDRTGFKKVYSFFVVIRG
jgi:hypothetical protein